MIAYENFGDVNPIEHGAMFVGQDNEMDTPCFYIIEIRPIDDMEEGWLFSESYLDVSDVTAEKWNEALEGNDEMFDRNINMAVSELIYHYGHTTFSDGNQKIIDDKNKLKKELADYGIHFDNDDNLILCDVCGNIFCSHP
jgi:hypothetical protein